MEIYLSCRALDWIGTRRLLHRTHNGSSAKLMKTTRFITPLLALLLYLEERTVGASLRLAIKITTDQFLFWLLMMTKKNIYTLNSRAHIFWSEWDEKKALHKYSINRDLWKKKTHVM